MPGLLFLHFRNQRAILETGMSRSTDRSSAIPLISLEFSRFFDQLKNPPVEEYLKSVTEVL